jgi:hypothetical protein
MWLIRGARGVYPESIAMFWFHSEIRPSLSTPMIGAFAESISL